MTTERLALAKEYFEKRVNALKDAGATPETNPAMGQLYSLIGLVDFHLGNQLIEEMKTDGLIVLEDKPAEAAPVAEEPIAEEVVA